MNTPAPSDEHKWLAERFEAERSHLRAVAYRMLGNLTEAEDAVQESWLHLSRADASDVKNLGGWLTTVVARVCLDMLRSRNARHEESLDTSATESLPEQETKSINPEDEALLADSVGLALLVVLDTLNPAERLAFVLHDLFAMPFDEIAPIVGRTPTATRQLASRARRRVRGTASETDVDLTRSREIVDAFLAASRAGNFGALLTVLDPDVVFRTDSALSPKGIAKEVHGAQIVARQFSGRAQGARSALVNGAVGVVVVLHGHLQLILNLTITSGKISEINAIGDPDYLRQATLSVLDNPI